MSLADVADWVLLALIGGALLLLPGLALRALLRLWAGPHDPSLGAPDRALGVVLDGLGLSLALWPLLLLYASLLGIPLSIRTVVAVLVLAVFVLGLLTWRAWRAGAWPRLAPALGVVAPLALLTGLTLVLRFVAIRGLVVPNWGDSFHHTIITQLFLEQQGVPHGYQPYAPVNSFTYHFGFHGLAAIWALLTGQPSWSAVLAWGQILNALAVPAAYVLTRELFRSRLAAFASAVVVGFLSGMPAQYVDWGRYTQLAGQVLLPFALVWFIRWVDLARTAGWGRAALPRLALAVLGAAGLGLTHYRVLIMYALFVVAYVVIRAVSILLAGRSSLALRRKQKPSPQGGEGRVRGESRPTSPAAPGSLPPSPYPLPPGAREGRSLPDKSLSPPLPVPGSGAGGVSKAALTLLLTRALAVGVLGGLLFAPWLGNLLANYLPGLFNRLGQVTVNYVNDYTPDAFLTQYIGQVLPVLAALGTLLCLIWGPARARGMTVVLLAWTGLLALSARPDVLHLPGVGAIGTFTIGIMLYLPLGTLAGPGIARLLLVILDFGFRILDRARRSTTGIAPAALLRYRPAAIRGALWAPPSAIAYAVLILAALALAASNPRALTPDPGYSYVTPDDVQALAWVGAHTPPGSHFLISAASTYQGRAVTAADAGMWLPLLTGQDRQTSVPPLSAAAEGAQAADYAAQVQALYTASLTPTLASNLAVLQRAGIAYVFLGEHTATIAPAPLLKDRADYCLLYRQGNSYVFGLRAAPSAPCK